MRNCLDIPGRVSPVAKHHATTIELQLVCKGGYRGPAGGSATAVPRGGFYIPRDTYGTPGARANKVDGSAVRMRKLRRLAREERVPWPRRNNRMPKTARYDVYAIYPIGGGTDTWKFGITRVGASRPRSQLGACGRHFGTDCDFTWLRRDIKGWTRARKWEAGHAARFKSKFGHCPPGMPRCL